MLLWSRSGRIWRALWRRRNLEIVMQTFSLRRRLKACATIKSIHAASDPFSTRVDVCAAPGGDALVGVGSAHARAARGAADLASPAVSGWRGGRDDSGDPQWPTHEPDHECGRQRDG